MLFLKIFKKKTARKVGNNRKSVAINPKYIEHIGGRRPNLEDRGSDKIRRSDVGSRSGIYYTLSDKQKDTLDKIIEILETESMGGKNCF